MHADFVPHEREITADYRKGETLPVVMHDGSRIVLRKLDDAYDPTDRSAAAAYIHERMKVRGVPHRQCSTWSPRRTSSTR